MSAMNEVIVTISLLVPVDLVLVGRYNQVRLVPFLKKRSDDTLLPKSLIKEQSTAEV